MSKRKHISWKTKCAAAVLELNRVRAKDALVHHQVNDPYEVPYNHAKQMTEDQFLSLYHWDHNILHSSEHEDRDKFWNLRPVQIKLHREKTKADAKIIAKSKRIRAKSGIIKPREFAAKVLASAQRHGVADLIFPNVRAVLEKDGPEAAYRSIFGQTVLEREAAKYKKLQSRGFDKTKTKGFDGKVRDRKS